MPIEIMSVTKRLSVFSVPSVRSSYTAQVNSDTMPPPPSTTMGGSTFDKSEQNPPPRPGDETELSLTFVLQ